MASPLGPPVNRDMRVLDRAFFSKKIDLLVAIFPNPRHLGQFAKVCKSDILYLPSVKHIVPVEGGKGVLLRMDLNDEKTYENGLSQLTKDKIAEYGIKIAPYTMKLDYDFWKADDILRAVLPENLLDDIPTGFAQAGHVAHLNLRREFEPYGKLIGQVILDKNLKVETVVNKVDSIATKFRTFQMEVLAGKDDLLVEQSECGCKFRFDFSKVYWNLRLNTEHERLIESFAPHTVVGDVFAGVGPFAVPAGKKDTLVLANDLNPELYKYLKENIALNKVEETVRPYMMDGRDFIRESPRLLLEWAKTQQNVEKKKVKRRKGDNGEIVRDVEVQKIPIPQYFSSYVMNLPDMALTFLDEFVGLYSRDKDVKKAVKQLPDFQLPLINCHCFEKYSPHEPEPLMEELHRRVHAKIVKLLDFELPFEECTFHLVRKVAPTKPMFCVGFRLPEEVAFRE